MSGETERLMHFLRSQSLHASRLWIEGCVEYYRSQQPGPQFSIGDLQNFALHQWLLVDLRTMGVGCFPNDLSNRKEIILSGRYAVQVESVRDVSTPAYSQLQIIRGVSTENCDATKKPSENWEPKPGRVLKLVIYDGIQECVAMEYSLIPEIDQNLTPGIKMLITGPLRCRKGILLLEQRNVKILGGEVDTMITVNALENILARALNLPEKLEEVLLDDDDDDFLLQLPIDELASQAISTAPEQEQGAKEYKSGPATNESFVQSTLSSKRSSSCEQKNNDESKMSAYKMTSLATDSNRSSIQSQKSCKLGGQVKITEFFPEPSSVATTSQSSIPPKKDEVLIKWPSLNLSTREVKLEPFAYLVHLASSPPKCGVFPVKGFLVTLLSTLEERDGRWHLLAKLTDGSANVNVDFSEEVLDEIIGFSAAEMLVMRQRMSGNPAIKERLKQGFQNAKKKLYEMNCLFYLEYSLGNATPIIIKVEDILPKHFALLKSRLFD